MTMISNNINNKSNSTSLTNLATRKINVMDMSAASIFSLPQALPAHVTQHQSTETANDSVTVSPYEQTPTQPNQQTVPATTNETQPVVQNQVATNPEQNATIENNTENQVVQTGQTIVVNPGQSQMVSSEMIGFQVQNAVIPQPEILEPVILPTSMISEQIPTVASVVDVPENIQLQAMLNPQLVAVKKELPKQFVQIKVNDLAVRDQEARLVSQLNGRIQQVESKPVEMANFAPIRQEQPAELAAVVGKGMADVSPMQKGETKPIQNAVETTLNTNVKFSIPRQTVTNSITPTEQPQAQAQVAQVQAQPVTNTTQTATNTTEQPMAIANAAQSPQVVSTVIDNLTTVKPTTSVNVEDVRQMVEIMGRGVFRRAIEGGGSIRLRLNPPELGQMKLEVKVTNENVTAQAVVESSQARQILVDNMALLKQYLAERGFQLDRFEVSEQPNYHQFNSESGADGREGFSNGMSQRAFNDQSASIEQLVTEKPASVYRLRGMVGNLSVVA